MNGLRGMTRRQRWVSGWSRNLVYTVPIAVSVFAGLPQAACRRNQETPTPGTPTRTSDADRGGRTRAPEARDTVDPTKPDSAGRYPLVR